MIKLTHLLNESDDIQNQYKKLVNMQKENKRKIKELLAAYNDQVSIYMSMVNSELDNDYTKLIDYLTRTYKDASITDERGKITISYIPFHKDWNDNDGEISKSNLKYVIGRFLREKVVENTIEKNTNIPVKVKFEEWGFPADHDGDTPGFLIKMSLNIQKNYIKSKVRAKSPPTSGIAREELYK